MEKEMVIGIRRKWGRRKIATFFFVWIIKTIIHFISFAFYLRRILKIEDFNLHRGTGFSNFIIFKSNFFYENNNL